MVESCLAFNCHNKRGQKKERQFYRLPRDPEKREKWIAAISRGDSRKKGEKWAPTGNSDHWRLCSDHFISGNKTVFSSFSLCIGVLLLVYRKDKIV